MSERRKEADVSAKRMLGLAALLLLLLWFAPPR